MRPTRRRGGARPPEDAPRRHPIALARSNLKPALLRQEMQRRAHGRPAHLQQVAQAALARQILGPEIFLDALADRGRDLRRERKAFRDFKHGGDSREGTGQRFRQFQPRSHRFASASQYFETTLTGGRARPRARIWNGFERVGHAGTGTCPPTQENASRGKNLKCAPVLPKLPMAETAAGNRCRFTH
jgi:hypothetical protein